MKNGNEMLESSVPLVPFLLSEEVFTVLSLSQVGGYTGRFLQNMIFWLLVNVQKVGAWTHFAEMKHSVLDDPP